MCASLRNAYDLLIVAGVAGERALKAARGKVRPQTIDIMQLCVSDFPEHEFALAATAASANQQVDGPCGQCRLVDLAQLLVEALGCTRMGAPPRGLHDTVMGGIVDHDAKIHPGGSSLREPREYEGAGGGQPGVLSAETLSVRPPAAAANPTVLRNAATASLRGAVGGRPRCVAQRLFPFMMIATCMLRTHFPLTGGTTQLLYNAK